MLAGCKQSPQRRWACYGLTNCRRADRTCHLSSFHGLCMLIGTFTILLLKNVTVDSAVADDACLSGWSASSWEINEKNEIVCFPRQWARSVDLLIHWRRNVPVTEDFFRLLCRVRKIHHSRTNDVKTKKNLDVLFICGIWIAKKTRISQKRTTAPFWFLPHKRFLPAWHMSPFLPEWGTSARYYASLSLCVLFFRDLKRFNELNIAQPCKTNQTKVLDCLTARLIDWLIEWLIERLIDWLCSKRAFFVSPFSGTIR